MVPGVDSGGPWGLICNLRPLPETSHVGEYAQRNGACTGRVQAPNRLQPFAAAP